MECNNDLAVATRWRCALHLNNNINNTGADVALAFLT